MKNINRIHQYNSILSHLIILYYYDTEKEAKKSCDTINIEIKKHCENHMIPIALNPVKIVADGHFVRIEISKAPERFINNILEIFDELAHGADYGLVCIE